MRTFKTLVFALMNLILVSQIQGQVQDSKTLFSIDDIKISEDEFLWMYNKNAGLTQVSTALELDQYLELFIAFKLKVIESQHQGFDEKPQFQREFKGYKTQLERSYLSDQTVTQALLNEAYERMQYDLKVTHVLVRLGDSIAEKAEIIPFEKRLSEMTFEDLRNQFHNGQTVFVEDLGYFSAFKMDYDFETMAYNTAVGLVSKPFKTKFGYHVLKVHDRAKFKGDVQVAHILLSDQPKDTLPSSEEIQMLYQRLKTGEDFSELAKTFSDDKQSSGKGGRLEFFRRGQLASDIFENECFSLTQIGSFSKPFQTEFGWHIVKLLDVKQIESFEMIKSDIENRIKRDGRSLKINEAFYEKLINLYQLNYINPQNDYLLRVINESFFIDNWSPPVDLPQDQVLFIIADQKVYLSNFVNYLLSNKKRYDASWPIDRLLNDGYKNFVNRQMYVTYQSELGSRFPEFKFLLNEYREGLLLFDVMQNNIWNKFPENNEDVVIFQEKLEKKWIESLTNKFKVTVNKDIWNELKQELLNMDK